MKRDAQLSKSVRWATVIALMALHPMLLFLMVPLYGEVSNINVLVAPIIATLMFNRWIGLGVTVLNVSVSAIMFRYLMDMGSEARPKAVLSVAVVAIFCLGAEKLRRFIMQRRAIEAELNQAKKMEAVGRLAGGVAHDMNNTLNAIMASVFAHRQELAPYGREFADLQNIVAACDRGAQLTRNLLGFARKSNYKRQTISLNEVVEGVHALLGRTVNKNIKIEIRLAAERPIIKGDRGQIENAVLNLCLNGLDAMGDRGTLTLSTRAEGGRVLICVSDTGIGMDEKIKERVFEPFFTTKAEGKGTGLGLSMVYGVVHAMSGRIGLDSAPGKGTTISLNFPRTTEDLPDSGVSSLPSCAVSEMGILTGRTVLLVDDDPLVLRAGVRMLRTLGCEVLSAASGRRGVAMFAAQKDAVDLVIVDLIMPEMDGIAVLEEILGIRAETPVLLVSGYTRESERLEALKDRSASVRFLAKPYQPEGLVAVVKQLLVP